MVRAQERRKVVERVLIDQDTAQRRLFRLAGLWYRDKGRGEGVRSQKVVYSGVAAG